MRGIKIRIGIGALFVAACGANSGADTLGAGGSSDSGIAADSGSGGAASSSSSGSSSSSSGGASSSGSVAGFDGGAGSGGSQVDGGDADIAEASGTGSSSGAGSSGGGAGDAGGGSSGGTGGGDGGSSGKGGPDGSVGSDASGVSSAPQALILYDDSNGRLMYVNNSNAAANWVSTTGMGRDLQLVGGGRVMLGKFDGWDEYRLSDGTKVAGQHGFTGTQDAYRLTDGNTMLAFVSGTSIVLKMVDALGAVKTQITYPGFSYVRLVRPTSAGTYLVTADTVVFEGNDQGAILWRVNPVGARHVWKAMRMANGNTVISTGYGATLVIYDSAGKLLQTIGGVGQPNAATIAPWFYADFHVMPNGGYFVVNSQADRTMNNSVQLLEYDVSGALIWQQKQPTGVRTLEEGIVLDGLDPSRLNVEPQGQLVPFP